MSSVRRVVSSAGQFAACLLHGKVGVRHRNQRIIGRGLEICLTGLELLTGDQSGKDGIIRRKDSRRADPGSQAEHHTAVAIVNDVARGVLDPAVMAVVVTSYGDRRQPQGTRLLQAGRRYPDSLCGGSDIEGLDVGQPKSRRQVNRQRFIALKRERRSRKRRGRGSRRRRRSPSGRRLFLSGGLQL